MRNADPHHHVSNEQIAVARVVLTIACSNVRNVNVFRRAAFQTQLKKTLLVAGEPASRRVAGELHFLDSCATRKRGQRELI